MALRTAALTRGVLAAVARTPGPVEAWVRFVTGLGRSSRLDAAWRYLPGWLGEAQAARRVPLARSAPRILFFAYHQELVEFSLALACLMVGRGARVDFAWSGHSGHSSEVRLRHHAWWRHARGASRTVRSDALNLISLEHVEPAEASAHVTELAERQALMDVSYICRRERLNLDSDPEQRHLYKYRVNRNETTLRRLSSLIDGSNYDRLIMPNGAIMELGAAFRLGSERGLPISTFEMWERAGTLVTSSTDPVMSVNTGSLWLADEPHVLTTARRQRVVELIERRSRPRAASASRAYDPGDARMQRVPAAPPERLRAELGLAPARRVALLCPNVPFDSMFYLSSRKVFDGMWHWLVETIRFLGDRRDCDVIVRSHPGEPLYASSETASSLTQELCSPLPRNVRVLAPDAPVNTYALMEIADVGIVYASTTGLEMALRGLPVVCGVPDQHYNGKGFTVDPGGPAEYFAAIDRILADPRGHRLTPRQVELAYCYADLFFDRWPRPFPWTAGPQFLDDVKQRSIGWMLGDEGWARYGQVVDDLLWGRHGAVG